jgi:hypothetical protein
MATLPNHLTPDQRAHATLTISTAAGATSDVLDCGGLVPVGVSVDSTNWTAAGIGFLGSYNSSSTMANIKRSTDGSLVRVSSAAVTTNAVSAIGIDTLNPYLYGYRFIQLFSQTTAGVAVVQATTSQSIVVHLGVPRGPIK